MSEPQAASADKWSGGLSARRDAQSRRAESPPLHLSQAIGNLAVQDVVRAAALPLDPGTRESFEHSFGEPLDDVRVHADDDAARSAHAYGARAYTYGTHIVFGAGEYAPHTSQGSRLLAHEIAHVVQQRRSARMLVQRQPETATTDAAAEPAAQPQQPAAPTDESRHLAYAITVLRRVPPLTHDQESTLDRLTRGAAIRDKFQRRNGLRFDLEEAREGYQRLAPEHGVPDDTPEIRGYRRQMEELPPRIEELNQELARDVQAAGFADEADFLRQLETFPPLWERRAIQIANSMLDQNREVVEREKARYRADVCSEDIEGLRAADAEMEVLAHDLEWYTVDLQQAETAVATGEEQQRAAANEGLPGGVPPSQEEMEALVGRRDQIRDHEEQWRATMREKQQRLTDARARHGVRFPVLFHPSYHPGQFAHASQEHLAEVTASWLDEILENIQETRENLGGRLLVWNLRDVPQLTYLSLGVDENSMLADTVHAYIGQRESDAELVRKAQAALAIGAGIVAAFATAGGSLIVAAAATGFAMGMTLGQLIDHAQQYMVESAANQIALDPVIADISVNEPELLPIVFDLIALGLDAFALISILRMPARVAMATGEIEAFESAARGSGIPPRAAEGLIARMMRRLARRPRPVESGDVYDILRTNREGGAHTLAEMEGEAFATFPRLQEFRRALLTRNVELIADKTMSEGTNAVVTYVRIEWGAGETVARARIAYNPRQAMLRHVEHELNHFTLQLDAGRVTPNYVISAVDAAEAARMRTMSFQDLVRLATARNPAVTEMSHGLSHAEFLIAELENSLRDFNRYGTDYLLMEDLNRCLSRLLNQGQMWRPNGRFMGQLAPEAAAAARARVNELLNTSFSSLEGDILSSRLGIRIR